MVNPADRPTPHARRSAQAVVCCALVLAAGCGPVLDTDYATVRGPSINGVSTFVQMLRESGRDVTATSLLPAADDDRSDALVVFADCFGGLPDATVERLRAHLAAGPRTVVLVVRDDDCAIDYWRSLAARPDLDEPRRRRIDAELAEATRDLDGLRSAAAPPDVESFGYTLEAVERSEAPAPLPVEVATAGGFADETIMARWSLHRRLVPGEGGRVQWRSGADPLLVRTRDADDEILVVVSATPLLNGGLVDPGNRRLAEDLVSRLPEDGRIHVAGSTEVSAAEEAPEPSMWRLLAVAPHPWIAAQALAALALFCWWRAPIVGRPRRENPALVQDFGHHVAALGALFARSRGDAFAAERIEEWRRVSAPATARRGRRRR